MVKDPQNIHEQESQNKVKHCTKPERSNPDKEKGEFGTNYSFKDTTSGVGEYHRPGEVLEKIYQFTRV